MKFLKKIIYILILSIIVIVLLYLRKFLQKNEIIVTNSTKTVITKLQSLNRLESAEMTITKIMRAEKEMVDIIPSMSFDNMIQDVLLQDKMIFELEWRVIAWIDLWKIQTGDIVTNIDGSVDIKLPKSEIFYVIIDENSKPYERRIWILTRWNIEMETKVRNTAKVEMENESIKEWILQVAKQNAIENLNKLFEDLNIRVKISIDY